MPSKAEPPAFSNFAQHRAVDKAGPLGLTSIQSIQLEVEGASLWGARKGPFLYWTDLDGFPRNWPWRVK